MPVIKELITRWGFKVDDKALDRLKEKVQSVKHTVTMVGAAATAAAGALFGLAYSAARIGDKAAKAADAIGMSVEALQEYRYVADRVGVSQQALDASLLRFVRRLGLAANGMGVAAESVKKLGIQLRDASGKIRKPEELLLDIAEALRKIPDHAERVQIAFDLFGREGMNLVRMMMLGRQGIIELREDARRLGLVIEEKAARQSEAFIDSLTRFKGAISGIRNLIGAHLMPQIQRFIDLLTDWLIVNRKIVAQKIHKVIKAFTEAVSIAIGILRWFYDALMSVVDLFGGAERVIKLATLALSTFITYKTILLIQSAAQAMAGLVAAITAGSLSAGAFAAVLAALIILAVLTGDEIYTMFQGGKTATEEFLEFLRERVPAVYSLIESFYFTIFDLFLTKKTLFFSVLDSLFGGLVRTLTIVWKWVYSFLTAKFPMIEVYVKTTIDRIIGWIEKKIDSFLDWFRDKISGIPAIKSLLEPIISRLGGVELKMEAIAPSPATVPPAAAGGGGVKNITVQSQINITAPAAITSEGQMAELETTVRRAVSEELGRVIRQSSEEL